MKSQPPPPDKEWDVDEFLIYITNEKNWKNGKPVWKGIMFPTLLNAISYFIRSLILSKDQEADRRVREAIGEIVIYGELLIENNHNYLTEVKAIGYEENNKEAVKSFWNALKNKLSQDKGKLSSK